MNTKNTKALWMTQLTEQKTVVDDSAHLVQLHLDIKLIDFYVYLSAIEALRPTKTLNMFTKILARKLETIVVRHRDISQILNG